MLDRNVGDALLRLDLSPKIDAPSAQIERIIDIDRRRVQRWTRIAITSWVLAAVGAVVIFVIGGLTFPMIAKTVLIENEHKKAEFKVAEAKAGAKATGEVKDAKPPTGTLENPDTPFLLLAKMTAICMVLGTASFMLLVFAGLATVLLLTRSRTATFRQINANLLQISEQLKHVPPTSTSAPAS